MVTVGIYYKIGFRIEPHGRSGFAHLFEHMMFQGSANAPKMQHIKLINSSGGVLNGSTSYDVTNYYEAVPSNALERVLWLEADRMRALKVDDENLKNQRDVVKEEVRVNVMNQPYGGFPWLDMPPMAFRNWANAHNFYGDFDDLDAANLEDVQKFFKTYYAPTNAVLLILGDVEVDEGHPLAEHHFGPIPAGRPRPLIRRASADRGAPRVVEEKFGTLPGIAIGYVSAPPHARMARRGHARPGAAWRTRGPSLSRTGARAANCGGCRGRTPVGDLFDYNGPTLMVTRILHKPEYSVDQTLAAYDQILDEMKGKGITAEELEPIKVKFRSNYFSMLEGGHGAYIPRYGLMHLMACFSLFDNDPTLVNTILGGFMEVTPERVQSVAQKLLTRHNRSIVIREPAKKGAA